ncbi:hypothetical protein HYQ46_000442 [Verticillium longisporum]|nr:hypothetical protein HYQ46_000442 [Verticillium longisporum]
MLTMVNKVVAEHFARDAFLAREAVIGLLEALGEAHALVRAGTNLLALAKGRHRNFQLLLDTAPAKRQDGSKNEVGVRVSAADANLEARGARLGGGRCDQADRGGAVLEAPGHSDGGPEVLDEALV